MVIGLSNPIRTEKKAAGRCDLLDLIGGALAHPQALGRNLGLGARRRLDGDPAAAARIRSAKRRVSARRRQRCSRRAGTLACSRIGEGEAHAPGRASASCGRDGV